MQKESENSWADSFKYMQKMIQDAGPGITASYSMIGSLLIFGIIGFFLDKKFSSEPVFLLLGIVIGLIIGFYEIAKSIWKQ